MGSPRVGGRPRPACGVGGPGGR